MLNKVLLPAILVGVAALAVGSARAQEPSGFKNLQVLPPDISKAELKATMEGFADQLNVRCSFCHVPDNYDKDDKNHKLVARKMLKLVTYMRANAAEYFKDSVEAKDINCWSCHRGQSEPEVFVPGD
jgi:hypothetical protein